MSPLEPDHDAPPVGEEIHLPAASRLPVITAIGITLGIIGITISFVISLVGLAIVLVAVVRWIGETRRDISELPLEQRP